MALSDREGAEHDWGHARRELLVKEVVCFFRGCSVDLQSFEEVRKSKNLHQHVDRGLQEIPVANIRGSVGRYNDFSDTFLPRNNHLRDRWEQVDVAMRQGKTPPIEAYQVGDTYFVVDGNHRVSVARQRHMATIPAYVTQFLGQDDIQDAATLADALISAEAHAFLESAGPANQEKARAMVFTCAGSYQTLADQIETYRQGYEESWRLPLSYEEAFTRWYAEVYDPSIQAIRKNSLLAQFPERTEADLFVWTWQNNQTLEDLASEP